ncbi:aldehyde dehydrogenase family protein [Psychromonas aquimarina]|uniref:aldehyde dehydrogenase family protein n=1 Tax=Psychromonas aquimarina TaxID=444919 RepID=UPI00040A139C|nr:aldehyde dehydrogenase family protein [Psychromonas aquimarina]
MNEQISSIIKQAHAKWEEWNELGCGVRGELILRWADETAQQASFGLMPAKMARYQVRQGLALIGEEKLMPGPTGESNELYATGRGVFIIHCSADAPLSALVGMISTALLAGNCIILALPQELQEISQKLQSTLIVAGFPKSVVQAAPLNSMDQLITEPSTAGVAYAGHSTESLKLNRQLADREGLLAQLILETQLTSLSTITDSYFILRFITEKTRTINVTAVGGNAALLELGCGDH